MIDLSSRQMVATEDYEGSSYFTPDPDFFDKIKPGAVYYMTFAQGQQTIKYHVRVVLSEDDEHLIIVRAWSKRKQCWIYSCHTVWELWESHRTGRCAWESGK